LRVRCCGSASWASWSEE